MAVGTTAADLADRVAAAGGGFGGGSPGGGFGGGFGGQRPTGGGSGGQYGGHHSGNRERTNPDQMFENLDTNHDGVLSRDEFAAMAARRSEQQRQRHR